MDKSVAKVVIRSTAMIPDTIARRTEGETICHGQTETGTAKWKESASGREKEKDAEMIVKSI